MDLLDFLAAIDRPFTAQVRKVLTLQETQALSVWTMICADPAVFSRLFNETKSSTKHANFLKRTMDLLRKDQGVGSFIGKESRDAKGIHEQSTVWREHWGQQLERWSNL